MDEVTVALGRVKRSTAGNRMRELLEKAHQQDDDELFLEEDGDEEFAAPVDVHDKFLDEFADTDDEAEDDEDELERQIRRDERQKAKGKSKLYNPLGPVKHKKVTFPSENAPAGPSSLGDTSILGPDVDPSTMAPSTLLLAMRKKRREEKRLSRDQNLRSTLRASTLRTEESILEREKHEQEHPNKKGRRAQHETGEMRHKRKMTQDELIAAALEEEERNKEALRDWVRREEERRELRRVGRKRVKGPRWTWVSRTVGRLVEEVEPVTTHRESSKRGKAVSHSAKSAEPDSAATPLEQVDTPTADAPNVVEGRSREPTTEPTDSRVEGVPPPQVIDDIVMDEEISPKPDAAPPAAQPTDTTSKEQPENSKLSALEGNSTAEDKTIATAAPVSAAPSSDQAAKDSVALDQPSVDPSNKEPVDDIPLKTDASDVMSAPTKAAGTPEEQMPAATKVAPNATAQDGTPVPQQTAEPGKDSNEDPSTTKYTRNYIILSQVPGGLAAELKLILGDHVEWDEMTYVPHRNRPVVRRPTICPFTGQTAKYRHPTTMTPYAGVQEYKLIEAMLKHRYVWNEDASIWWGGESDQSAEGVEGIEGWAEAVHGGWLGGHELVEAVEEAPLEETLEEAVVDEPAVKKGKRKAEDSPAVKKGSKKGRASLGGRKKGKS